MNSFESSNQGDLVHNIQNMIYCPFCSAEYFEKDIKIMARYEHDYVAQLFCQECGNKIMANISYKYTSEFLESNGLAPKENRQRIDLPMHTMMEFVKKGTLRDEEILDFYKSIKGFDGDFQKAFQDKIQ